MRFVYLGPGEFATASFRPHLAVVRPAGRHKKAGRDLGLRPQNKASGWFYPLNLFLYPHKAEQARGKKKECRGNGNRAVGGNKADLRRVDSPRKNDIHKERVTGDENGSVVGSEKLNLRGRTETLVQSAPTVVLLKRVVSSYAAPSPVGGSKLIATPAGTVSPPVPITMSKSAVGGPVHVTTPRPRPGIPHAEFPATPGKPPR